MTQMEKGLATQILESRLVAMTLENDKGAATILRAEVQSETIETRLNMASTFANNIFAIHQTPGKYSNEIGPAKWQKMIAPMVKEAILDTYGAYLQRAGVEDDKIKVKGNDICQQNKL